VRAFPALALSARRLVSLAMWKQDVDPGATAYADIRRLRPCERIVAGPGGVRVERTAPRVGSEYRRGRPEDFAVELRERLDAAVGRCMSDAKRVAVFVSGGLDSSGVLALAAARCRGANDRELQALSFRFQGPGDDRPYLDALVDALGLVPLRLPVRDAAPWFWQSRCVDGQPGLLCTASLMMLLCAKAAKMDVALTGVGGDLICGGPQPIPFFQLVRRGHPAKAVTEALRFRVPWRSTPWSRVRQFVVGPLVKPLVPKIAHRVRIRRADRAPWMTPRFLGHFVRCTEAAAGLSPPADTPDAWMARLCDGSVLPDTADLAGQANAVTQCAPLDPFRDFDFVRFILQIDPLLLGHGHTYRGLYRLAMKGVLPDRVRLRADKGKFEPGVAAAALAANALEGLRDLASLDAFASLGFVDPGPFRPIFNAWLRVIERGERPDRDPGDERLQPVWQLLSIEAFLREHGKGRAVV
jgi:asparagine synthase (glutamine-hydrolysing)